MGNEYVLQSKSRDYSLIGQSALTFVSLLRNLFTKRKTVAWRAITASDCWGSVMTITCTPRSYWCVFVWKRHFSCLWLFIKTAIFENAFKSGNFHVCSFSECDINHQILLTRPRVFVIVLVGRRCLDIRALYLWRSLPLFSSPVCLIMYWYYKEKLDTDQSC